jgi:chromosome segregation ATPase
MKFKILGGIVGIISLTLGVLLWREQRKNLEERVQAQRQITTYSNEVTRTTTKLNDQIQELRLMNAQLELTLGERSRQLRESTNHLSSTTALLNQTRADFAEVKAQLDHALSMVKTIARTTAEVTEDDNRKNRSQKIELEREAETLRSRAARLQAELELVSGKMNRLEQEVTALKRDSSLKSSEKKAVVSKSSQKEKSVAKATRSSDSKHRQPSASPRGAALVSRGVHQKSDGKSQKELAGGNDRMSLRPSK